MTSSDDTLYLSRSDFLGPSGESEYKSIGDKRYTVVPDSFTTMLRKARMMYALPLFMSPNGKMPFGYDRVIEVEHPQLKVMKPLLIPHDKTFELLVMCKYMKQYCGWKQVTAWLNREMALNVTDYDWDAFYKFHRKKERTEVGIRFTALEHLMNERPPLDICVLPLDERERIFRAEIKSIIPNHGDVRQVLSTEPNIKAHGKKSRNYIRSKKEVEEIIKLSSPVFNDCFSEA